MNGGVGKRLTCAVVRKERHTTKVILFLFSCSPVFNAIAYRKNRILVRAVDAAFRCSPLAFVSKTQCAFLITCCLCAISSHSFVSFSKFRSVFEKKTSWNELLFVINLQSSSIVTWISLPFCRPLLQERIVLCARRRKCFKFENYLGHTPKTSRIRHSFFIYFVVAASRNLKQNGYLCFQQYAIRHGEDGEKTWRKETQAIPGCTCR